LVAEGWSTALQAEVREWETLVRHDETLEIQKEFEITGSPGLNVTEHWTFASALDLADITSALPVRVEQTYHGYGPAASQHRLIHVLSRVPADSDGTAR
jgi:hypothetical protein